MAIKKIGYTEARTLIRSGDILLWSPTSLPGRLIGWATRNYRGRAEGPDCQLSHAGMASWSAPAPLANSLEVLEQHESLQWYGTRTTSLGWMVEHYPGCIHVYRVNDASDADSYDASRHMRRRAGTPYGWLGSLGLGHGACAGGKLSHRGQDHGEHIASSKHEHEGNMIRR